MADKCENIATVRRYWPGSDPDLVCVEHAEDSQRIAQSQTNFPSAVAAKDFRNLSTCLDNAPNHGA
jgi:hypothetical protein